MRVEGVGGDAVAPSVPVAHQAITLGEVTLHWRGDRSALMLDAAGQPDALLVADVHLGKAQRYRALGSPTAHREAETAKAHRG